MFFFQPQFFDFVSTQFVETFTSLLHPTAEVKHGYVADAMPATLESSLPGLWEPLTKLEPALHIAFIAEDSSVLGTLNCLVKLAEHPQHSTN